MHPSKSCGHTYRLKSGKIFSCTLPPHPTAPSRHFFERDKAAETAYEKARQKTRPLHTVPGERRG